MWANTRQILLRMPLGGRWALALPGETCHNLRWFWFDGLFAVASDNIMVTYLTLYILALGATKAQIGLMSALSSLSAALLLLPGALLVERIGHRKQVTMMGGGGFARLAILALALSPFASKYPALVWIAIALSVTRDAFANLSFPAWLSLTSDIVPLEGRGRYFGSRNFAMGIGAMVTTLLVGEMITRAGAPAGYQLALLLAFALGLASTFSFSRLKDSNGAAPAPVKAPLSLPTLLRGLKEYPVFISLCATAALWNLSLNIAGPFFNVYLVQNLGATAAMVGITSVASSFASLSFQHKLGELADRWGPSRLQMLSMIAIPILPFGWIFINAPWQVIPLNLLGGLLWGAFNLASFNFLLTILPDDQRARYSALYQIVVTLSLAAGATLGSVVITHIGYKGVFLCSTIGRLVAAFLFVRLVLPPMRANGQIVTA